jgi:hypothetical protein
LLGFQTLPREAAPLSHNDDEEARDVHEAVKASQTVSTQSVAASSSLSVAESQYSPAIKASQTSPGKQCIPILLPLATASCYVKEMCHEVCETCNCS